MRLSSIRIPFLALLLAFGAYSPTWAEEWTGRVVGVTDGDTIDVMRDGKAVRVRLHGIDCPESGQAFGSRAKQFTSEAVFDKDVRVVVRDMDRYGRTVGEVFLTDGSLLNASLVTAGLAWWYREYAPADVKLQRRHLDASTRKVGLWSDPNPIPPWEFRRGARTPDGVPAPSSRPDSSTGTTPALVRPWDGDSVYVTRTGAKYHLEGCGSLAASKIEARIQKAVEMGYTPCSICKAPAFTLEVLEPTPPPRPAVNQPRAVPRSAVQAQAQQPTPAARPEESVTVYITNTGQKYHSEDCRSLSKSKISTTLATAVDSGYGPCSICDPPRIGLPGPTQRVQLAPPASRAPPAAVQSRPPRQPAQVYQAPAQEQYEATVYVTNTGEKYHSAGCQYLRQSSIPMSLSAAKNRYGPCSRCAPPQ